MPVNQNKLIDFNAFASSLGIDPNELYKALREFLAKEGEQVLTLRQLQKLKSDGITRQAGKTRDFLVNFSRSPAGRDFQMSPEAVETFLSGLGDQPSELGGDAVGRLLDTDPEILRTLGLLFEVRDSNAALRTARSSYAGYYYLVRRSSSEGAQHFYEEPFRLADQGGQSFLIPFRQDVQLGFSLASSGACTTFLFNRHHVRTVGVSVVILYGHSNPELSTMSGVMLRFSDDLARPSACQVLARRVDDTSATTSWQSAVDGIADRMAKDPNAQQALDAVESARQFTRRVGPSDADESFYDIYQAFGLEFMAKALDQRQWDKALSRARLTDEELALRFRG